MKKTKTTSMIRGKNKQQLEPLEKRVDKTSRRTGRLISGDLSSTIGSKSKSKSILWLIGKAPAV
jgi:hypothetical protein